MGEKPKEPEHKHFYRLIISFDRNGDGKWRDTYFQCDCGKIMSMAQGLALLNSDPRTETIERYISE